MAKSLEFTKAFKKYAHKEAIVYRSNVYTYQDLLDKIETWDRYFSKYPDQAIFAVESDFSVDSIAIVFSLIKKNAIIVPLDIKNHKLNQKKYDIAEINFLLSIENGNYEITEFPKNSRDNEYYSRIFELNVPGLVLFTSGSSGNPKGAVHNFSSLLKKFEANRPTYVTINFLLFDHWGGLNTMFHILSNGGKLVLLEERQPDYICSLIQKYEVELLPTSPTFLNMLLASRAYKRYDLSSLKLITYGSEPMPENVLKLLNTTFAGVKFHQTYGLIELGVMQSKSESNGSLWVKIGGEGYKVRVNDNMLEIKSNSEMLGYLNAPSPFTDDGWFKTGDLVEVKGEYFKILGRQSELINVGGEKVFPQEVENVILQMDNVLDVLVYGEKNLMAGNIVCAKVQLKNIEDHFVFKKELKQFCRKRLERFKIPARIKIVDHNIVSGRFKKQRFKSP
ncbi:MAG: long-chain fatty acid--CoA ligase [Saprospiraceae bacterium]